MNRKEFISLSAAGTASLFLNPLVKANVFGLQPGTHTLKITVKGEKKPESAGSRIYITEAIIFKSAPKKNNNFKFSFQN